jgi:hypothetical protein
VTQETTDHQRYVLVLRDGRFSHVGPFKDGVAAADWMGGRKDVISMAVPRPNEEVTSPAAWDARK